MDVRGDGDALLRGGRSRQRLQANDKTHQCERSSPRTVTTMNPRSKRRQEVADLSSNTTHSLRRTPDQTRRFSSWE